MFIKSEINCKVEFKNIGRIKAPRITILREDTKIYITVIYRSPLLNVEEFNNEFKEYLAKQSKLNWRHQY